MQKYEYKIVTGQLADLNTYGAQGWNLVAVTVDKFDTHRYYFKRRIENKFVKNTQKRP